ncbi:MAG: propanoyl-CoA acyltransferase [Deltaproteobacteria bacterium]|uniref:Propanoyl-CoA acyltransferase n=1 Tax=Candidatus Zymogenus saltonus TaxID=2844893 RepID=A0A9D8KGB2_9DELT|nr:propanoyl-CoA acyltransferase [Candidatus Zymogenus saltonus]
MKKVAVIGVAQTNFTAAQDKTEVELFAEAALEAMAKSNIKPRDIQALFVGNVLGDFSEGQGMVQAFAAENIGCFNVPANRYEGACASASMAVRDAFMWVASGFYDIVLAGGVERAATMGTPLATRTFAMFSDSRYEFPSGITFPGVFAMLAHLYASHYNVPLKKLKEQMAQVSVQSYKYGMHNPKAQMRKEVTIEDVLNSFMVSTPIQLHDCCPFSDGGSALILASEDAAKKLTDKPVYITGVGQASAGPLSSQKKYLPRIYSREVSSKLAYKMAGRTPDDIDVCELHDCFSIASIIAVESLGFFEFGTSGEAWMKGEAAIGGKVAINPSGGLKAKGHPIGATGGGQVYEIVNQLRGEVEPERLVEGAKIGMTDTLGGDGGTLVNIILERGW